MQTTTAREPAQASSSRYAWYVVGVLTLCYMLSFIDRQILSLLVTPIKRDLGVSDTRVGLLQGLAFAIFYGLAGLPLGRLVDTRNRRNLVIAGVALWSAFTCACSGAKSFVSLFLARIGVGVGEASLNPAAFSIISDYFPPERLATATSVFYLGALLGSGLAFAVGGTIVDAVTKMGPIDLPVLGSIAPWRLTFLTVGVPGLLVALLVATVREPLRRNLRAIEASVAKPPFRELAMEIRRRWKSLAGISISMACQASRLYGFIAWAPTFFVRVHHWSPGEAGRALGLVTIVCGCSGMLVGGRLSDSWQSKGISDGPLRVGVIGAIGCGLLLSAAFAVTNLTWTLTLLGAALFFNCLPMGSAVAALQMIYPNQMRGLVSAIFLLVLNLGGLSLGPLLPGVFNDYLFRNEARLGASMSLSNAIASVFMLAALLPVLGPYRKDYWAAGLGRSKVSPE